MLKFFAVSILAISALVDSALAAELALDFNQFSTGAAPTGFVSAVSGSGKPGDWKIVEDEIPFALEPISTKAPKMQKRRALAQLSQDPDDEHFPLLIYQREIFDDFTLTTRFKCVGGKVEQMAGIAFRIQDEKNYYVVRASAMGNSFRFYKFVNGQRSAPIGPVVPIPLGVWHEMTVECKGNQIRCLFNGKEVIPALTDNSFAMGKVAYWTKSDSVSHFADTHIVYKPRINLAQVAIGAVMREYPRLIGLKLFTTNSVNELRAIASSEEKSLGELAQNTEAKVIATRSPHYVKSKEAASVIMPIRDRNGDTVGALRIILKPFPGQTENNVLARALPIAKEIESRLVTAKDWTQ